MGNDNDTSDPSTDAALPSEGRRKREPPTIELAASEVVSEAAGTPSPEPEPEPAPAAAEATATPRHAGHPGLTGALTGAGAAVAVLAAAWFAGWPMAAPEPPPPATADTSAVDALASRLATLETDFRTVAALPRAAGTATADLARRIDALEHAQTALSDAIATGKAETETLAAGLGTLTSETAALKAAPREAAAAPDLSALEARLAAAETAARRAAENASLPRAVIDEPLRRAVTATQLETAVRQGTPYAALLTAAKSFASDAAALAPLDGFAATGLPSATALGDELLATLAQLAPSPDKPDGTSPDLFDRLQASAARLVRIRRDRPIEGNSRDAVIARAAAAARRGDVDAAKRELTTLPAAERTGVAAWLAKIDAREAALAAARRYAVAATAALTKPAP